jgi:hypothetical protein
MLGRNSGNFYSHNVPELADFTWDLLDGFEPCDECDRGLVYLLNYEGRRLCRNCLDIDIEEKGFDVLPESWLPQSATTSRTYVQDKKRYITKALRQEFAEDGPCDFATGCIEVGACYGKYADNTGPRCLRGKPLF